MTWWIPSAWAVEYTVGGGGDFPDLATAAVGVADGDVLLLLDAVSLGDVVFTTDVTLRGGGAERTRIIARAAPYALEVVATHRLALESLTVDGQGVAGLVHVRGGLDADDVGFVNADGPAGLLLEGDKGSTLTGCVLVDNAASVTVDATTTEALGVTRSWFAYGSGGVELRVDRAARLDLVDAVFTDLRGAAVVVTDTPVVLQDVSFFRGQASALGLDVSAPLDNVDLAAVRCEAWDDCAFVDASTLRVDGMWAERGSLSLGGVDGCSLTDVSVVSGDLTARCGRGGVFDQSFLCDGAFRFDGAMAVSDVLVANALDGLVIADPGPISVASSAFLECDTDLSLPDPGPDVPGTSNNFWPDARLDDPFTRYKASADVAEDSWGGVTDCAELPVVSGVVGGGGGMGGADADGDGWCEGRICADPRWSPFDCDDAEDRTHPLADDLVADGLDADCDGLERCWVDADGDGFGGPSTRDGDRMCLHAGLSLDTGDCDDAVPGRYPGAPDTPGDGVDSDCDGAELCYRDADGDGFRTTTFGPPNDGDCTDPGEAVGSQGLDCDDTRAAVNPLAAEVCDAANRDEDCDGLADDADPSAAGEIPWYRDVDGDTFGAGEGALRCDASATHTVTTAGDCAPTDPATHPGAAEIVGDPIDNDCDGAATCFADGDDDGDRTSASAAGNGDADCADASEALATDPVDCDDADPTRHHGAFETAGDSVDQDCDGGELCFTDSDGDGYGFPTPGLISLDPDCFDAGESGTTDDCAPGNAAVNPGATELPADLVDQDCDGAELCFTDSDGDAHGTTTTVVSANLSCANAGEAFVDDDCDDARADRYPGNVEVPSNGVDEDCDGFDEVLDSDGDTYDNTVDCDDADPAVHPGATELPGDLVDQDCDGGDLCWADLDGDGHGGGTVLVSPDLDCATAPEAATGDDCDDTDAARAPSLPEVCDPGDVDEDCDGLADDVDASAAGRVPWFVDTDGDGFGGIGGGVACEPPAGATLGGGDCDDLDGSAYPGATEAPGDGVDRDCDGGDLCFADADADGARTAVATPGSLGCDVGVEALAALPVDCDDADPTRAPGALEVVADGVDQDCDLSEVCWLDADDDGVGAATTSPSPDDTCDGAALAWLTGDCNDADPGQYPGLPEIPADGIDQNCDGLDGDVDLDHDGALTSVDCDDTDSSVYPGAPEVVGDGVDQDCDGADLCHEDTDLDGFGSDTLVSGAPTCASAGVAVAGGDCDDADGGVSPGAGERPADGVDQDCDGVEVCFVDADGDTFGDAVTALGPLSCAGFSTVATDCDDDVATTFPGAVEACDGADTDCVGGPDATEADRDGDRFVGCQPAGWVATPRPIGGGDCDDLDRAVHPGVFDEVPGDGVDQDCDGFESCLDDSDGDGFGGAFVSVPLGTPCADVAAGDCDDADADVFPGAPEGAFDGVDQDCDGDPGCVRDADGDGVGGLEVVSCRHPDAVTLGDDCDDADASRWPGAAERCDGLDEDCDGVADDGLPVRTWYVDGDGDGVGAGVGAVGCDGGDGDATVGGDCDDADPARHPGAAEACGQDLDCDGVVFECTGADADGDGFCADVTCATGDQSPGDCDDDDASVHPGAEEDCGNGVDDDCDGRRDFRGDVDGDGVDACLDCDDLDRDVSPGAFEVCDGVDGDCDGAVDEGLSADQDGDGWNDAASCELPGGLPDCDDRDPEVHPFAEERFGDDVDQDCDSFPGEPPPEVDADGDGFCAGGGHDDDGDGRCDGPADGPGDPDCDDFAIQDHPGAPELADGADNDCDGVVDDLDPEDADGDGFYNDRDCDDHDGTVFPGAEERCNGVDDACDGGLEDEVDLDVDGFRACVDCDDRDATVFPGAEEDCGNGVDDNCDGTADDRVDRDGDGRSECDGDCAPQDPTIPAAVEACNGLDDDCNGTVDEGFDVDGDGVTACPGCVVGDPGCDCDDLAARVHPGAIEVCFNVVDENCDGSLEDTNADGDPFTACGGDCDDAVPTVFPGAHEECDGVDQDCDGVADDGYDVDEDGVLACAGDCNDADASVNAFAAEECGDGTDQDCDTVDLDCPPECAAVETCGDGVDDDCDGLVDADDPDCATAPEHTGQHSATPVGRGAPDARCGCGHVGGSWAPGLLALVLLRRRRAAAAGGTTP